MKPLSGVDGAFLHIETPETPMHVASLHLFDLPRGYARDFAVDVRTQLRERLHVAPVLTRKLAPMLLQFANPVWIEDEAVDLDYHVQAIKLAPPGTQRQLEDCVARLHAEPLDRQRPLWRVAVIGGLRSGQAAYYFKVHHAVLDGQAGVRLSQALFDLQRQGATPAPGESPPAEHPGLLELAAAALRHDAGQWIKLARQLPEIARALGELLGTGASAGNQGPGADGAHRRPGSALAPCTPLNLPIGAERSIACTSLPMDALQALADAHDATLNDIVLALCAGCLRRHLARRGGIPAEPLVAAMPISLRRAHEQAYTTRATMSRVTLATNLAHPIERLHAIRDATRSLKATAGRIKHAVPTDFPSIGEPWLLQALAWLYGRGGLAGAMPPLANVVISNIAGPTRPLYTAGARMASYWPLSIPEHGLGLNITVMSYAGQMGFGFTAARCAVPDARKLVAALHKSRDELELCTGGR